MKSARNALPVSVSGPGAAAICVSGAYDNNTSRYPSASIATAPTRSNPTSSSSGSGSGSSPSHASAAAAAAASAYASQDYVKSLHSQRCVENINNIKDYI